jgi:long-chain fatty acid transport protein
MEFPDNGSEQGGRGGAWVARASDPLAAFYNPAGLAGQPTRLILQSNVNFQSTCFTRLKATNDITSDPNGTLPGKSYPQTCSADGAAVDPQIAMTIRLSDRVGLGIAPILAPSAGASNISFPEFITTTQNGRTIYQPSPARYLMTGANLLVLNPTIGVGAEVIDRLRLGASFQWGISSISLTSAVATGANLGNTTVEPSTDVKAVATAHDYFIPGFTVGAIYSPTDDFDLAGWFRWSDAINATGDIKTTNGYYTDGVGSGKVSPTVTGDTSQPNCGISTAAQGNAALCGTGGNAKIKIVLPMEAKLGLRYHKRRSDVPYNEHVRDPLAQDVFDVEFDLTWANNSAASNFQVRLPGDTAGNGIIPVSIGVIPPNDDIPHGFKDVYGVRLGGDYNVLRDRMALRAGAFFQSNGRDPTYQNIDFPATQNGGLAAGLTYRLHLSSEGSSALEISLGYEHVFYASSTNNSPNGVDAIAGSTCVSPQGETATTCANGQPKYRSSWPVNLGTITDSINVLNIGLGYRF